MAITLCVDAATLSDPITDLQRMASMVRWILVVSTVQY